jgi:HupE / UreJ protein
VGVADLRSAFSMTRLIQLAVALCLLLPSGARAHEIGTSNVRFALHINQTWSAVITTAPAALANKIGPQTGQPRVTAFDADIVRARLTAATQLLADYVEVRFDGAVSRARVTVSQIEMPNNDILPDFVELRAEGAVPAGAKAATWRFGLIYATYAVVFTDEHGGSPVTQWLDGDAESKPFLLAANAAPASRLEIVAQYVKLGFSHIVPEGLDHILFVLGIFLLTPRLRPILVQVTAFTIAHSVTLGLTMYGVLSLPSHIVEPLIALSIAYVAIENLLTPRLTPWRPVVVFGFGLIHGMGFAGALAELNLPRQEIIPALISFNVGIELAQLTVIAVAYFAVAFWLNDKVWYRARVVMPACAVIAAIGLFWTVRRILEV